PNLTAFTGVDSQNLPDVMVSVQFILAIGGLFWTKSRTRLAIKGLLLRVPYFVPVWSWKIIKIFLRL
ncbi:hypothetical protein, partial [Lactobacillus delbrueckii]|uniref:hypothetical protein n=1 Tax=Lactobacillus delbrueckii TaxID=1584 RepID=UPI0021A31C5D